MADCRLTARGRSQLQNSSRAGSRARRSGGGGGLGAAGVVVGAFLGVAEDAVGFGDGLEHEDAVCGAVGVGVVSARGVVVGGADLVFGGAGGDAEQAVVVGEGGFVLLAAGGARGAGARGGGAA